MSDSILERNRIYKLTPVLLKDLYSGAGVKLSMKQKVRLHFLIKHYNEEVNGAILKNNELREAWNVRDPLGYINDYLRNIVRVERYKNSNVTNIYTIYYPVGGYRLMYYINHGYVNLEPTAGPDIDYINDIIKEF